MSDALRDALTRAARDYADGVLVEDLVEAGLARRDWRLRRSAERECVVCGAPLAGSRRSNAETCSPKCRQAKARQSRLHAL